MIKRIYYKQDHGDGSGSSSSDSSSSSSSSSDSGTEADSPARPDQGPEQQAEQTSESESESGGEGEEEDAGAGLGADGGNEEEEEDEEFYQKEPPLDSPGSGYESEDSSGNEVEEDSPGITMNLMFGGLAADMEKVKETKIIGKNKKGEIGKPDNAEEKSTGVEELDSCILKCKSVFRCKLCPRIICLSEKIVKQHLESKRHARSKKLSEEGRLKVRLNSDGELEEDYETHAERYARTLALAEEGPRVSKKDSGRQRQSRRRQKRSKKAAAGKAEQHTGSPKKKKQKSEK